MKRESRVSQWVRLDNASNIFLAARNDADPKVFRFSAEMDHEVDPECLQDALDETYERYPLYHAVLRRGIFWYYLQQSDLHPRVTPDDSYPCAPIYLADRRTLLFRVMYHDRRVILEIFHALSDGTGALWFLTDLVNSYVERRYSAERPGSRTADEPSHELTGDSFTHYFRRARRSETKEPNDVEHDLPKVPARRVFQLGGTRTPDNRPRVVELTMPATDVLALARTEGVSLSVYLTALFFESARISSGDMGETRTIAASVPVNLRQFFPSDSARNFFATVRVGHTYGDGDDSFRAICASLESQLRAKATSHALERKVRRLIRFERMPLLRIVPRPLKDVILRIINWGNNRGLSLAISNMGRVTLPEFVEPHVARLFLGVSAIRPQFCALSHGGSLTITFTSPFVETDHVREFARMLTSSGVDVTVSANRTTEDELAEAAT